MFLAIFTPTCAPLPARSGRKRFVGWNAFMAAFTMTRPTRLFWLDHTRMPLDVFCQCHVVFAFLTCHLSLIIQHGQPVIKCVLHPVKQTEWAVKVFCAQGFTRSQLRGLEDVFVGEDVHIAVDENHHELALKFHGGEPSMRVGHNLDPATKHWTGCSVVAKISPVVFVLFTHWKLGGFWPWTVDEVGVSLTLGQIAIGEDAMLHEPCRAILMFKHISCIHKVPVKSQPGHGVVLCVLCCVLYVVVVLLLSCEMRVW